MTIKLLIPQPIKDVIKDDIMWLETLGDQAGPRSALG